MSQSSNARWMRHGAGKLTGFREFMLVAIILVGGTAMSFASPHFFTVGNCSAMLLGISFEVIIAIGMTVLLVSGGFDLSVGSTMALSGAVSAMCLVSGWPVVPSILAGLLVGAAVGVINGLIIAKIGINPFITTLGMMGVVRGVLQVVVRNFFRGSNITGLPDAFTDIGQEKFLVLEDAATGQITFPGIQYPIIIALVLVILADLLLRKSRFLRQNYYIGGNEKAAILSGINVDRMKVFNYGLTGLLAALAGILLTARFGSATVTAGVGVELKVISAVIIGGASLSGGEGTVIGAFLGALLMSIIISALTLLGVDDSWTTLVIGATLLVAVMIDTLSKKFKGMT
jgi:ribose transport system permease protein